MADDRAATDTPPQLSRVISQAVLEKSLKSATRTFSSLAAEAVGKWLGSDDGIAWLASDPARVARVIRAAGGEPHRCLWNGPRLSYLFPPAVADALASTETTE